MEVGGGGGVSNKKMERKKSAQTGWANRFGRCNLFDKFLQCSVEPVRLCLVHARKLVIFVDGLDTYDIADALKRRYFSNINPSEVLLRLGPRTNLVIAVPGSIKRKKKIIECL
jgi:hypothetical protein